MIRGIVISVVCGIAAGYFLLPRIPFRAAYAQMSGTLISVLLCVVIFLVGICLGRDEQMIRNLKNVGVGVLVFPVAAIVGTFAFTALASLFLPVTLREAMAVGCGFGWYSFAPVILLDYSPRISAVAFLLNVMRELAGIVMMPVLANRIGYIEAIAIPGVAAMDVCLPIVEKEMDSSMVVVSFAMGLMMALTVPLTGFIVGL